MVAGFVLVAIVPVAVAQFPREMSQWQLARAQKHYLDNDLDGVREALDAALSHDPSSYLARADGASMLVELGDAEGALALATEAIDLEPNRYAAYLVRSQVYQKLGKHREAVADTQVFLDLVKHLANQTASREATGLNAVAYARAVGNLDLDEALQQVEQAIKLDAPRESYLDTRGYIQYLRGNYEAAHADLDEAVTKAERWAQESLKALDRGSPQGADAQLRARQQALIKRNLAVIYYHRSLVLAKQNEAEAAQKDLARVRELGCEPGPDLY